MILVTGATGFVGRALVPRLVESGAEVRCLIRPSLTTPRLPRGVSVQVAVSHLDDARGVRAALSGVDTVIHLATAEWHGKARDLARVDQQGTLTLLEAARGAGVQRVVYLSHLGADKASAFQLHRVKGQVEDFIRKSGLNHMILRSSLLFGPEDVFTNAIAMMMAVAPGMFLVPGDGRTLLQPLWIDDLVTCIEWGLDDPALQNTTIDIGGPEFLTLQQVLELIMARSGVRRPLVYAPRPYLRWLALALERLYHDSPFTTRWVDRLAVNRTCELTSVTRYFGLRPSQFEKRLDYLKQRPWRREFRAYVRGETADEASPAAGG